MKTFRFGLIGVLAVIASMGCALAQSTPGFVNGQVPSASQWNSYFAAKQDLNGTLTGIAGGTINSTPGTFGSSTNCVSVTANAAGLITSISQTACAGGGGGTPANPTATIGASAVNGAATTYMRSDAAPALPATLPALNGSNLTALNPSNLSAAVPVAKGGTNCTAAGIGCLGNITGATGTPSSTTFLRGDNSWATPAGGGSVSITCSAPLTCSPNPMLTTATIGVLSGLNAQTGTSYTVLASDMGGLLTQSNTAASAWSLPTANGTGFEAGKGFDVQNNNFGILTITPVSGTIGGAASLQIPRNTGCSLIAGPSTDWLIDACTAKGRNDVAINFSGTPAASQTFTYAPGRAFSFPAGLTGSRAVAGTNPAATWTFTIKKNGSSIGSLSFNTSGVGTYTFASATSFNGTSDILTVEAPASPDASGKDAAMTLNGTLN